MASAAASAATTVDQMTSANQADVPAGHHYTMTYDTGIRRPVERQASQPAPNVSV